LLRLVLRCDLVCWLIFWQLCFGKRGIVFLPPVPPFRVDYFCPRQSPNWQVGKSGLGDFVRACQWATVLKPGAALGRARVVDARGVVVYSV